jgi:phosphate transport system substrate-binding protein
MDGSVTMVKMMKYLREGYQQVNPKIQITYGLDPNGKPSDGENIRPTGSSGGLKNLIKGTVTMAASSRPLKPDEAKAGIKLIPIARDAIAVVVGINNPFKGGLTTDQLRQIYQGQITNWSQVGGIDKPIKVYNRGAESGTKDFFKEQVLLGNAFAPDSNNFKTWERDETTAVLRVLADDGIYYASVFQAQGQELIRVVPIEGIDPLNKDTIKKKVYPLSRDLYLAIPDKTSPEVKQFIEFARSPQGQQLIEKAEFISIL